MELAGAEVGLQQVEVERLPEPGRTGVEGPALRGGERLGHRGPRRVVLVEDLPPLGVDLVHLVAVVERVGAVQRHVDVLQGRLAAQRLGQVLGQRVGHVDAVAVDPAVGPEAQGGQEVVADLPVVPVEVGLLGGEQVAVPLARRPVASVTRVQAGPPKCEIQSDGGWSPFGPRPSRKM